MKNFDLLRKHRAISLMTALLLSLTFVTPSYGITLSPSTPTLPNNNLIEQMIAADYDYTATNGKTTITKYKGTASNVTIPSQLGGYPVKVIGFSAFNGNKTITSVVIPEGVVTLEDMSFYNCSNLTSVKLPSTLTAMKGEVFAGCIKLTSVQLPDNLTVLDSYAFHHSGLTSLTLPKSLTDYMRLVDTGSLTAINVVSDNPAYTAINGVLYTKDKKYLIHYPTAKPDLSFNVPDGVTLINYNSFYGTKYLQNVTIPASALIVSSFSQSKSLTTVKFLGSDTIINANCFQGCTALTSVSLPSNLKIIKAETFSDCASLKSIVIPPSVTTIEKQAFAGCTNLESINLPIVLKEIQSGTFNSCKALYSLAIPDNVTLINNYAFYGCSNLSTITIPANVMKIGASAFKNCTNLLDARFRGDAPEIGKDLFAGTASNFVIYYLSGKLGWTTPTWYGYPTKMYFSISDLPVVKYRLPITFPIPSNSLQIPPLLQIRPIFTIPTLITPAQDEEPDLLPPDVLPDPEATPPAEKTEIKLYLGQTAYMVNGQPQSMDASPVLLNGRILLPVRYVAVPLGASTEWNQQEQKVTVTLNNNVIELWIGNNIAKVNGEDKMIDPGNANVKPIVVPPGRTMLPLRFLGESLGCEIVWNQTLQEATLTK